MVNRLWTNSFWAFEPSIRLAREQYENERKKYDQGHATTYTLLQYQRDLDEAMCRYTRALVEHRKALAELEKVKGTILSSRGMAIKSRR